MVPILHLRKELNRPPVALALEGVRVRSIVVPDDVEAWLVLRRRAMAGMAPAVREWNQDDFAAQMLEKPWWRADRTWLAIEPAIQSTAVVGAVTLAVRMGTAESVPIVHWLLVDPARRRRGVGRLLMSTLESAAWDAGWRHVELETHAGWNDAVAFYQSMGYAPVRERSPR